MADAIEVVEVEVIKRQMADQREALGEKLETLETQVGQATTAVGQAVDAVTDTMQASVETVREAFDVRRQIERHPWAMVGGSVAIGLLGAWLLPGKKDNVRTQVATAPLLEVEPVRPIINEPIREPARTGWFADVADEMRPEMLRLKGLAIGTLLALVRDAIADVTPEQVRSEFTDVADRITTKLGGEPIGGRVLPPPSSAA